MKRIIITCTIIGILASCNTTDKDKKVMSESENSESSAVTEEAEKENVQLMKIDTDEALIATSLMAAPKESRAGSKVIGYNMAGEFVTLKEGDNEFIVLADDPKKDGFSAACYHKDLEPFMARGSALKA